MSKPDWEAIDSDTFRLKVPGGWLVKAYGRSAPSICFVPDLDHEWKLEK